MKKFKFSDIGIGVLFTLLFISLGVVFVINFRALYQFDINHLNIDGYSGLSKDVIMQNYNALIDYCSPFFRGTLEFPTLPSSESGLIHFAEVKNIFTIFYVLIPITAIPLGFLIQSKRKKQEHNYLLVSSITCIVLPAIVGLACAINFDKTFVIFHKLFFRNDYWLFDPQTDPIITLLPQEFFLHCALFIVGVVCIGSVILFYLSKRAKKKYRLITRKE